MKIIQICAATVGEATDQYSVVYGLDETGAMYLWEDGRLASGRASNGRILNTDQIKECLNTGEKVFFCDQISPGWVPVATPGQLSTKKPHPLDPTRCERS